MRPIEEVARFLGGAAPVEVVAPPSHEAVGPQGRRARRGHDRARRGRRDELEGSAAGAAARATSIWPHVEERIVDLIEQHRSTIVFANSRRLAERLTARLNEIAAERRRRSRPAPTTRAGPPAADHGAERRSPTARDPVIARAHHGSVSKEQRALIEDDLKPGRLPCVVATSSLELGIDMGAVDLVIQVESPPSVASGAAAGRPGRPPGRRGLPRRAVPQAPRRPGADRGRRRADARRRRSRRCRCPANPLDVLAQQVVACASLDDVGRRRAARRRPPGGAVRRRCPGRRTTRRSTCSSGRYPSDEFAELRPRLVWDRVADTLTGRPGRAAAGGHLRRHHPRPRPVRRLPRRRDRPVARSASSTRRWSTSPGSATCSRSAPRAGGSRTSPTTGCWSPPRPGSPAGCRSGRATRSAGRPSWARPSARSSARSPRCRRRGRWPAAPAAGLDAWAADNLVAFLARAARATTGDVPHDRTLVVERFRDELGDWRLVVHSPYGAQVHAPVGAGDRRPAAGAVRRRRPGDGRRRRHRAAHPRDRRDAARRRAGRSSSPTRSRTSSPPRSAARRCSRPGSASARRGRCCCRAATRAAARRCGSSGSGRAQLLEVAAKYASFPIVLEAVRECLQDVYDVPGAGRADARHRRRGGSASSRSRPRRRRRSPGRCCSATSPPFIYEGDSPLAERRAAALALDPALLAELLGRAELRELLDPEVLDEVEAELQRLADDRRARDAEGVADLLRLLGPLSDRRGRRAPRAGGRRADLAGRCSQTARRVGPRSGSPARSAGPPSRTSAGCATRSACRCRRACPRRSPSRSPTRSATWSPASPAPTGRSPPPTWRTRLGLGVAVATRRAGPAGGRRAGCSRASSGPAGAGAEWCDAEVLRRLRRRSLARLRKEVEPVEPAALGRFLPAWQNVGSAAAARRRRRARRRRAARRVRRSPPRRWSRSCCPPGWSTTARDARRADRVRRGDVGRRTARCPARRLGLAAPGRHRAADPARPARARAVADAPGGRSTRSAGGGAYFFRQLSDARRARTDDQALTAALWDLVWSGQLTNDTLAPLRALVAGRGRTAHRPAGPAAHAHAAGRPRPPAMPRAPVRPTAPAAGRCCPSARPTRPGGRTPPPRRCSSGTAS